MIAATLVAAAVASGSPDSVAARTVVHDVNTHRVQGRVTPLTVDPELSAVALDRAHDLVRRRYFAHVTPEGTTAIDVLRSLAYPFSYAGENLAEAASIQAADSGLWASPEHRENIMEAHYTKIGIAVVPIAGGELVVQIFTD